MENQIPRFATFMQIPNKNNPAVLSVSSITEEIKFLLEDEFQMVHIRGEVSQPKTSRNGHVYFTLKDNLAQLPCVIWNSTRQRLSITPNHGDEIIVDGSIQLYAPHGRYQLIVESIQPAGAGALQIAFERLKKKLESEGLFDPARKKPLPAFPESIGVITSSTGAAFQDIRNTLEKRFPICTIKLWHASVQGVQAVPEIVEGIRYFSERNLVDILIIGRGGGSLEDLWAFNEEAVARAISESAIPVISAVGHETDFSISDFVADARAATPTQAVLLAVPDAADLRMRIDDMQEVMDRRMKEFVNRHKVAVSRFLDNYALRRVNDRIGRYRDHVRWSVEKLHQTMQDRINRKKEGIQRTTGQLSYVIQQNLHRRRTHLSACLIQLEKVNPKAPLEKGFTRILQDGQWIRRGSDFNKKRHFEIEWRDKKISPGNQEKNL